MEPLYLTARDADGQLRGLARVFRSAPHSRFYDPSQLFQEVLGPPSAAEWWPCLSIGSGATTNELLVASGREPADRRAVAGQLADAICDLAAGADMPVVSMYMPEDDASLLQAALGSAVRLRTGQNAELPIRYSSTEEYLASLSAGRRSAVRKEMRRFQQAGYTVTMSALAEVWREIAALLANVDRKYHVAVSPDERRAELEQEAGLLSDGSVVYLCRDPDGALMACSVLFRCETRLYARYVGFDYRKAHSFEYFNLLFYLPVEYAIAAGITSIHYGLATSAKLARGAQPIPMYSVIWRRAWPTEQVARRAAIWNAQDRSIELG